MKEIDLLFIENNEYANLSSNFFDDIAFYTFKDILSDKEYGVFSEIIKKPLTNIDLIKERQNILIDFIRHPHLCKDIIDICTEALNLKTARFSSYVTLEKKLKEYLRVTDEILYMPQKLFSVLKNKNFISTSLSELQKELKKCDVIDKIKTLLHEMCENITSGKIAYQISFGDSFKLTEACIFSKGQDIHQLKRIFFKKTQETGEVSYGFDFLAVKQVNDVQSAGFENLLSIMSHINSYIHSFCDRLREHAIFYFAAQKIIKFFESKDIKTCFPQFSSENAISTEALYDMGLVVKAEEEKKVVPNNLSGDENAFCLISGVNQGGKTTFLKSIGLAQIFAQNGMPVAASMYKTGIYKNFVSHFPCDEDSDLNYGKLAEELDRFRASLPLMSNRCLVLMNESFATTTEKEGAKIAEDVLFALSISKPTLFFVTHNEILLKKIDNLKDNLKDKNVNLHSLIVVQAESPTERTYMVTEGQPQEKIYTIEFLKKFI